MAAPVLAFGADGVAVALSIAAPVNATQYMLRYELNVTTSGTAGAAAATLTIANDPTTAGPNFQSDCINGSPLQGELDVVLPAISTVDARNQIFENDNLRVTVNSSDGNIVFGVTANANGTANPILTINAFALTATSTSISATVTIEFRHSIDR